MSITTAHQNKPIGPYEIEDLFKLHARGWCARTYVLAEGTTDWQPFATVLPLQTPARNSLPARRRPRPRAKPGKVHAIAIMSW